MFFVCSFVGNRGVPGRIGLKPPGRAPRAGETGAGTGQALGAITPILREFGNPEPCRTGTQDGADFGDTRDRA